MKRVLWLSLLLNLVLVGGWLSRQPLLRVEGQVAGKPSGNGDVNCDGDIDVSDPVYLLRWLFSAGEPPCALAQSPDLEARVAALEGALASAQVELATFETGLATFEGTVSSLEGDVADLNARVTESCRN